jgi:hypothetical protein
LGLHPLREIGVMIPGMVVGVGHLGPDHFDDPGARFNQPRELVKAQAVTSLFA